MNEFGKRVCEVLELDERRVRAVELVDVAREFAFVRVEYRLSRDHVAAIMGDDNPTGKPERVPREQIEPYDPDMIARY